MVVEIHFTSTEPCGVGWIYVGGGNIGHIRRVSLSLIKLAEGYPLKGKLVEIVWKVIM